MTDNQGATGSATAQINVSAPPSVNQPPVAQLIASPTNGTAPLTVQFTVSGSHDPDGTIAQYTLSFGDGFARTETDLNLTITHQYVNPGGYTVQLIVTDNQGATGSDSHIIMVNPAGPPVGNDSWLIFDATVPPGTNNWTDNEIYRMDLDGSNIIDLTNNLGTDFLASPSPDGQKIIFVSRRDCGEAIAPNPLRQNLYIMDSDGTNQRRLTSNCQFVDWYPSFSPDSSKVIFGHIANGIASINLINADGTGLIDLGISGLFAKFTPDGTRIVYSECGSGGIFIRDLNSGATTLLTPSSISNTCLLDVSPDGNTVIFDAFANLSGQNHQGIFAIDINGANLRQLAEGNLFYPAYSPDGTKIAFVNAIDSFAPRWEIFLMDSNGGNQTQITNQATVKRRPGFLRQPLVPVF